MSKGVGIRDSFTEMTFEKRCERREGRVSFENIGDVAGRWNGKFKGPEMGACLSCSKNK